MPEIVEMLLPLINTPQLKLRFRVLLPIEHSDVPSPIITSLVPLPIIDSVKTEFVVERLLTYVVSADIAVIPVPRINVALSPFVLLF